MYESKSKKTETRPTLSDGRSGRGTWGKGVASAAGGAAATLGAGAVRAAGTGVRAQPARGSTTTSATKNHEEVSLIFDSFHRDRLAYRRSQYISRLIPASSSVRPRSRRRENVIEGGPAVGAEAARLDEAGANPPQRGLHPGHDLLTGQRRGPGRVVALGTS